MKFLKSLFKYLGFFLLGVLFSAVAGFTALSYFAVDQLSQAFEPNATPTVTENSLIPPINPNLKEVILIGANYVEELDLFDQLNAEIAKKSKPEICSILCKPIGMDRERLSVERTSYLATYYKYTGIHALEDPLFRLRMEEIGFLAQLFPDSLRSILRQVVQTKKQIQAEPSKFGLALQLQWALFKEISSMFVRWEDMKAQTAQLNKYRELIHSCERGASPKKVLADCNIATH